MNKDHHQQEYSDVRALRVIVSEVTATPDYLCLPAEHAFSIAFVTLMTRRVEHVRYNLALTRPE